MKRFFLLLVILCGFEAHAAVTQFNALSWAKADGSDQTVNIQRAVNAAVTAGQSLYIPPGISFNAALLTNTATVLIEDYTTLGSKWIRGSLLLDPELDAIYVSPGTVSSTEFGYIDGITAPVMDLFNLKLSLTGGTVTGPLTVDGKFTATNVYILVDDFDISTMIVGSADIPFISTDQLTLGGEARTNWTTSTLSAPLIALESGIGTGLTNLLHAAVTNAIGASIYQPYAASLSTLASGNGSGLTSLSKAAITNALGATGISTQYLGGDGSFHDLPATGGSDSYDSMVITNLNVTSATVSNLNVSRINNALTIDGNLTVNGDLSVTGNVALGTVTITNLNVSNATITNLNGGISTTNDVLVAGGTTNRMVFFGGILISNIANFFE